MLDAGLLPLRNDRAVLRAMQLDDVAAFVSGTTDPQVRSYAHLPEPEYTEASVTALVQGQIRAGLERGDLAVLTIADPATDAFAGSLVLFGLEEGSVEVGFWVHPDHRGKGIAGAGVALAVEFARRSGLIRLTARSLRENAASQRVLDRIGFIRGEATWNLAPSGEEVTLVHHHLDVEPGSLLRR